MRVLELTEHFDEGEQQTRYPENIITIVKTL